MSGRASRKARRSRISGEGADGPACARVPVLGDYFRRLRRSRRLTQAELAARTVDSPFPVDQSYVSRLERGEIAGSVGKFFTVLSLVNANASSVAELLRLGRELPVDGQGFAVEELLRRARESTKQGELSAALSWALAGLHEAASSGDADGHAQALVSASIVLKNQGAWETARALALEAVNLAGIHQVTRLQAVLQSAACCLEMDEPVSAELLLDGLQEEVLADRPELAAQRWHNLGLALLEGGRPDQALEAFRKAADWYARSPSPSDEARLHARQAVVMVDLGLRDAGAIVMDRAFGLAERSGHAITRARVLLHAGRVDTLLRDSLAQGVDSPMPRSWRSAWGTTSSCSRRGSGASSWRWRRAMASPFACCARC